ncbi:MAG: hypothetical protein QNJ84_12445 [Alphaproteobacteria bacterium]|nr:hypothetical protein [Alphaproteobacteria bacterium]
MRSVKIDAVSLPYLEEAAPAFRLALVFAQSADRDPNLRLLQTQLENLQVFAPTDGWPFMYCGGLSTTAYIVGKDAARRLVDQIGVGSMAFHAAVTRDYHETAATGRPIAQRVKGVLSIDGRSMIVSYYRFVFRMNFQSTRALASLTRFVGPGEPLRLMDAV